MDPMVLALLEGVDPKTGRSYKNREAENAFQGKGRYQENPAAPVDPLKNYNPSDQNYRGSDIYERKMKEIEEKKRQGPPPEMLRRMRLDDVPETGVNPWDQFYTAPIGQLLRMLSGIKMNTNGMRQSQNVINVKPEEDVPALRRLTETLDLMLLGQDQEQYKSLYNIKPNGIPSIQDFFGINDPKMRLQPHDPRGSPYDWMFRHNPRDQGAGPPTLLFQYLYDHNKDFKLPDDQRMSTNIIDLRDKK